MINTLHLQEKQTIAYGKEDPIYRPSLIPDQCPETYTKDIFTDRFIEEYSNEVSDEKSVGFNNAEWLAIVNFYIQPDLCQHYHGLMKQFRTGSALVHHLKPGNMELPYRSIYSDTTLNIIIPLSNKLDSNAEILFFNQNCTLNSLIPGIMYVFPGEITHLFEVSIKSGQFSFAEIKVGTYSQTCYESYGSFHCPGFNINEIDPPNFVQHHPFVSKADYDKTLKSS